MYHIRLMKPLLCFFVSLFLKTIMRQLFHYSLGLLINLQYYKICHLSMILSAVLIRVNVCSSTYFLPTVDIKCQISHTHKVVRKNCKLYFSTICKIMNFFRILVFKCGWKFLGNPWNSVASCIITLNWCSPIRISVPAIQYITLITHHIKSIKKIVRLN